MYTCTDLEARGSNSYTQVQIINLDVKDNHEDATLGAFLILELCNMVRTVLHIALILYWVIVYAACYMIDQRSWWHWKWNWRYRSGIWDQELKNFATHSGILLTKPKLLHGLPTQINNWGTMTTWCQKIISQFSIEVNVF